MSRSSEGLLPPFVETDAEVIERGAVCIEAFTVRPVHRNKLRRQVQNQPELSLSLSDHRFCVAVLADVGNCSYEFKGALAIPRGVSCHTDILDQTVGQLQAMLKIKTFAVTHRAVDLLLNELAVLRMNSAESKFQRRFRIRIALKDSEGL